MAEVSKFGKANQDSDSDDQDEHEMMVDDIDQEEDKKSVFFSSKFTKDGTQVQRYKGGGQQMAKDIVTYFLLRFFFKDLKDKKRIFKMKDDFLRDLNFSVLSGKVARATLWFSKNVEQEKEKVEATIGARRPKTQRERIVSIVASIPLSVLGS